MFLVLFANICRKRSGRQSGSLRVELGNGSFVTRKTLARSVRKAFGSTAISLGIARPSICTQRDLSGCVARSPPRRHTGIGPLPSHHTLFHRPVVDTPIVLLQPYSRREFCAHACRAASVLALGSVAACGGSPTSPSSSAPPLATAAATVAGRVVSVTIDSASVLAAVGSAATVQTPLGTFLVAHTAQNTFTALTATCTHEGCTISGFAGSQFVCPCHGSQFTASGGVANGPATRSLQAYPTQFANSVLIFTV
jgi:nitrite reductase/ring-hydroxylating ferredoxin subunit